MNYDQLIADLKKIFDQFMQSVIAFLPNFIGALVILLIGVLVARLLRALVKRLIKNFGRFIPNKKIQTRLHPARMERPSIVIGNVLYWIVIFFFLTAATETLGLPVVSTWLSGIANYLPKILTAVLFVSAGIIGGVIIRDLITTTTVSAGIAYGNILGRLAQYAILLITILIGIEQVGIDITFLTSVILILTAAMLFGAALAFGLGARASVSNILASYYLQKMYHIGQTIKIAGMEGRITQMTPIAMILETQEGQVYVPAKQFNEATSLLLTKGR